MKNLWVRFKGIALLSALLFCQTSPVAAEEIRVMTQNLYLGAEIQSLAKAESQNEFISGAQEALLKIAVNNFPERAQAIASEIIEKKVHLVCLQEVFNFTIDGLHGPPPFRDYLDDLLNALSEHGMVYKVAGVVKNLDITIPVPGFGLVGVTDRDVIIAQEGILTTVITGICDDDSKSEDGCNYEVNAAFDSPLGLIEFLRGFVGVQAVIGNVRLNLFNTHLESRDVDPEEPLSPYIQSAQGYELITYIGSLPNSELPVFVAGDINSSPEHQVLSFGSLQIIPPYMQLLSAGLLDTWDLRPGKPKGFTCCQDEILFNSNSATTERVDVIFINKLPDKKVKANVVGDDEADKTITGLWPSDHAGVVTRLELDN